MTVFHDSVSDLRQRGELAVSHQIAICTRRAAHRLRKRGPQRVLRAGFLRHRSGADEDVKITEHVTFSLGAQAYNLFNHANFDQPVNDIANPEFGYSTANVGPPTSLLGSFVGAGRSPRFVEIKGSVRGVAEIEVNGYRGLAARAAGPPAVFALRLNIGSGTDSPAFYGFWNSQVVQNC